MRKIVYVGQANEKNIFIDREWVRYPKGVPILTCDAWADLLLKSGQFREAGIEDALTESKILVIRNMGLGDVLMVVAVLKVLKEIKNIDITLATNEEYMDLVCNGIKGISVKELSKNMYEDYDLVINLNGVSENYHNNRDKKRIDIFAEKLGVDGKMCKLVYEMKDSDLGDIDMKNGKFIIGLVLKASSYHRSWKLEYYKKLVEILGVRKYKFILLDNNRVEWEGNGIINMTGRTTIRQAIALLGCCDVVVTPDTGLMHACEAIGVKAIALFGPIDPELRIGYYKNIRAISMKGKLSCVPCVDRPTCGEPLCMNMITPNLVIKEVKEFLKTKGCDVSVIVVSKGGKERSKQLKKCLKKVKEQKFNGKCEIILVLKDRVDFEIDNDVNVIYQKKKRLVGEQGISDARMTGVKKANGEWICFVDDDNVISEKYLSTFLSNISDLDKIYSCSYIFDDNVKGITEVRKPIYNEVVFEKQNIYPFDSLFFHRSVFDEFCLNEKVEYFEDWEFFRRVFKKYKPKHIDKILLHYNHNEKSLGEEVRKEGKGEYYFHIAKNIEEREKGLISIVIPVWMTDRKQVDVLKKCLSKIEDKISNDFYDILLVDDCSVYNFQDEFKSEPYEIIETPKNLLFSNTVNYGVEYLKNKNRLGEYLLIMNYDILLDTKNFDEILKKKINDESVVVGILLKYPDNRVQFAGGIVENGDILHYRYKERRVRFNGDYFVDYCTGAFMFMKSETFLRYGMFDKDIIHTYEDTDFSLRVRSDGKKVLFTPEVSAIHLEKITNYDAIKKEEVKKSEIVFWNKWKDRLPESEVKYEKYFSTSDIL